MKHSVLGFSQQKAVELGLSSDELLVLRWFVDFSGTNKMTKKIVGGEIYYWVNYQSVLDALPILKLKKQALSKKIFKNLCDANVLKHTTIKVGGTFSYYCYGINYGMLVYLEDTYSEYERTKGVGTNVPRGEYERTKGVGTNVPSKDSSINNSSIKDSSINNNIYCPNESDSEKKVELVSVNPEPIDSGKMKIPPSLEEVENYCMERNNTIDAEAFIDFYTSKGWLVGKAKMKDWKAAMRTWERKSRESKNVSQNKKSFMDELESL